MEVTTIRKSVDGTEATVSNISEERGVVIFEVKSVVSQ